jgi:SAM-dependent methyltransferase
MAFNPMTETPWPHPNRKECYFYHSMKYPDGETIQGDWTIPDFENYIGGYDLRGKSVLDVGTATGFLAFNAERVGADVTGLDAATAHEFTRVPFAQSPSYQDIASHRADWTTGNLVPIKKSWWYGWHKNRSKARCVYAPIHQLYEWDQMFDVVLAGAIIEHLSDPIYSIGAWTKVASEAVIIPFTDVIEDDSLLMRPMTPWNDSTFSYLWWQLSRGLWRQVFNNVGFEVSFAVARAQNSTLSGLADVARPTIIARRDNKLPR